MKILADHWEVTRVDEDGALRAPKRTGLMFEADGIDGAFLGDSETENLQQDWRSAIRLQPGEELQILFRKRVEFSAWVEEQLSRSFLGENIYGRRILLDRLADQVKRMGKDVPKLLSQKILICFWTPDQTDDDVLHEKRLALGAQLNAFGISAVPLDRKGIEREINVSARDLKTVAREQPEWPALHIAPGVVEVGEDSFRALELTKLPENSTWFGMIQSLTRLPYPLDVSLRLKAKASRPLITRLERKRNLLNAQRASKSVPLPAVETQLQQIHEVLRSLAEKSESIFTMQLTVGLRLPKSLATIQRHALGTLMRAGSQLDFCDLDECTLNTFDAYLECIPGFRGKSPHVHTVLSSNAIHFLPFFRPAQGDDRAVISFQTREASLYAIDPVDSRLANYNWLVSGTSGAGKSFFVNSLISQSTSLDPNVFIVDIGGSYNKLTRFLNGKVLSLEPGRGFALSPFFLERVSDPTEEKIRRRHIFQVFLEMVRVDGRLPGVAIRQMLSESLDEIFALPELPKNPISYLIHRLKEDGSPEAKRLALLLQPWSREYFLGQFLDNDRPLALEERIVTVDLKGLTEFEDLSRVVQLIVCAGIWARVRQTQGRNFSWIVLDEVAFSLLKTQSQFVDELVSTLRKHFAGAVVVVQDLQKITSNPAGASILQNTQSKAILQQRGDPKNYAPALNLNELDRHAIQSLRRKRGSFSDIFLIRDTERTVIRHAPSPLEYWLSTTAPEDTRALPEDSGDQQFRDMILDFSRRKPKGGFMMLWFFVWQMQAAAQTPISAESMQLRILINKSEEQIRALNEVVKNGQRDSVALERASKILSDLHAGMDKSIEKYQGTKTYQDALLKLQAEDGFKRTYADAAGLRQRRAQPVDNNQLEFQKQSVLANQEDLVKLEELERALKSAEQGLVPKIQAQAQIGAWQANARVSAQMTELLSSIQAMREEMRGQQESNADPLSLLLKGTEAQNNKQSEMRRP